MPKLTYFKRFRMELDLRSPPPPARLPDGFYWLPWDEALLDVHAEVKYLSFHRELDATVVPSLGFAQGCRDLMLAIRLRLGFCPQATWLVAGRDGCVGTVQGVRDDDGLGAIQNLGVLPEYRGQGVGRALLLQALAGFRSAGVVRAFLEVTADNAGAVRMYRTLGFRCTRTVYRAIELPDPDPVGMGL